MPKSIEPALKALASDKRLQILDWLKQPTRNFPPQVEAIWKRTGSAAVFLTEKLGVSQPAAAQHLKVLVQAGLVTATRKKQWTFYKRNEAQIRAVKTLIAERV